MFTGLVEEIGTVESIEHRGSYARLTIQAEMQGIELGESIAVNGACQTVERFSAGQGAGTGASKGSFTVAAFAETLKKTNLGLLKRGKTVHLERALRVDDRLGGHVVQGHVDGLASLRELRKEKDNYYLCVQLPPQLLDLCIEHGSICLDGVSLTIARLLEDAVELNIIEHTWRHCHFSQCSIGSPLNIECDVLGKYMLRFAQRGLLPRQGSDNDPTKDASLLDLLKDW